MRMPYLMAAVSACWISVANADSNTANMLNAMAACGAGLSLNIDANLQGSVLSLYEKEKTVGRAIEDIAPKISALVLSDPAARKDYTDCLIKIITSLK